LHEKSFTGKTMTIVAAEKDAAIEPAKKRQDSNWYSKLVFYHFVEIIRRGAKRELLVNDFQQVEEQDDCAQLSDKIYGHVKSQLETDGKVKLWSVMAKVYFKQYSVGGFFTLIEVFVQLAQGWALSNLLQQLQQNFEVQSYYYAIVLSVATFLHGCLHHVHFFINMRTGMDVRVGLIAAIYRKCLALSVSNSASTGFIVNVVSNDVQRFEDAAPFAHYLWVAPIQLVLTLYFVYLEIGWLFCVPMVLLLLLIPLQTVFARLFMGYRSIAVRYRDDRIKSLSDLIKGIMVVKVLYSDLALCLGNAF
jgi:ATP-binding cassette subfamily C (CFTR/MRP) protein 4